MDSLTRGNAAEAAVLAALISAGIPVLMPFGQGMSFDLAALAPSDGRLVRIQVKSGRIRNGCVMFNTTSTDHGGGRQTYEGRADLIAVHVRESNLLFVVPVDECPAYEGVLRIEAPRNNQRRRIRLADQFRFDRWAASLREAVAAAELSASSG